MALSDNRALVPFATFVVNRLTPADSSTGNSSSYSTPFKQIGGRLVQNSKVKNENSNVRSFQDSLTAEIRLTPFIQEIIDNPQKFSITYRKVEYTLDSYVIKENREYVAIEFTKVGARIIQ